MAGCPRSDRRRTSLARTLDKRRGETRCTGTDSPYEEGDTFVRAVESVIDATNPAEAHAILDTNAMARFGIRD